jgi:predicted ATPase
LQYSKTPYDGLVRLFQDMLRRAIQDHSLETVSKQLHQLSQMDVFILSSFVPGILGVLGITEIPTIEQSDVHSRVATAVCEFINLLSQLYENTRVVIMLDDLQRADSNSISLIKEILLSGTIVFALCTYRDNEESDLISIEILHKAVQQADIRHLTLALSPLGVSSIECMIQEMIGSPSPVTGPLAILTKQKTQGNPFFICQVSS